MMHLHIFQVLIFHNYCPPTLLSMLVFINSRGVRQAQADTEVYAENRRGIRELFKLSGPPCFLCGPLRLNEYNVNIKI